MTTATKITAFIDASDYTESVIAHASWVSATTGYSLELVHAVDHRRHAAPVNLTGNLTLGARTQLLDELTAHEQNAARLAKQAGFALLDDAKALAEKSGAIDVTTRLRTGDFLSAIQDVETDTRLLILGKRGEHADFASGHLGSNLERVVRSANKPVLVSARAFTMPDHAVIAFDGGTSMDHAIAHIAGGKLFKDIKLTLLHATKPGSAPSEKLDAASDQLKDAGFEAETLVREGEPEAVITDFVAESDAGLLVMGAYGHSRIRTLIIGSTTTAMVRNCPIPVMMFRPETSEV
jgi:nucleotide-binding universal stress UspA family protein